MLNVNINTMQVEAAPNTTPMLEPGTYPAVISMIVELGKQRRQKFETLGRKESELTDRDFTTAQYIWVSYTLPTERYTMISDEGEEYERDQVVGEQLKWSTHEKSNLVKRYTAICRDGRDFMDMIGMPVTVTTGLTSGGKPKVIGVSAPMKGTQVAAPLREPLMVQDNQWDQVDDIDMPEFIRKMIKERVK